MKHLSEYRDGAKALKLAAEIARICKGNWAIMEVCGGQTHSIIRNGIDQIVPQNIEMIHGPGCPVCVTPISVIDKALEIAARRNVLFCSFGDMLRVPGTTSDLYRIKGGGGDVRIVYSPLDAVKLARKHPTREVVFLAIGFETTAPANAMAVKIAQQQDIHNFSVLVSHVLVPPAIEAIMNSPGNRVQAFLAAGHVCSVMGFHQYHRLASQYSIPIVVTGFEPLDLLDGIRRAVVQLEAGQSHVENAFPRVVTEAGNEVAQATIDEVFETTDRAWRGIGVIPQSGWRLKPKYAEFDAERRFAVEDIAPEESNACRAGEVLRGALKPHQCEAFGKQCTPRTPLGATMVSSEGACAAYYNYGRFVHP
ncbi:hydrogenase formation protein HypD [Novipirellula artificiosorum]|uniref:Hydrogenase expression/formation protein HypD n=1 Tax=Novipirellula artificiosorum TaxID=2528016 RepID=A0A5C6DBT5_9BACT|nr:hydrogenase formation protein HypD [Novipirellula artificiosorum]TWU34272.1 Hydrogenase expression/formation protein HypD [Novipirellula artificiosorum]